MLIQHFEELAAEDECESHFLKSAGSSLADELATVHSATLGKEDIQKRLEAYEAEVSLMRSEETSMKDKKYQEMKN